MLDECPAHGPDSKELNFGSRRLSRERSAACKPLKTAASIFLKMKPWKNARHHIQDVDQDRRGPEPKSSHSDQAMGIEPPAVQKRQAGDRQRERDDPPRIWDRKNSGYDRDRDQEAPDREALQG